LEDLPLAIRIRERQAPEGKCAPDVQTSSLFLFLYGNRPMFLVVVDSGVSILRER
jgi:hypothetical protein